MGKPSLKWSKMDLNCTNVGAPEGFESFKCAACLSARM